MSKDPYKYFRLEGRELLTQFGAGVLELEKNGNTDGLIQKLLRIAHTLKGAARVVKLVEIADYAHKLEDALAPVRTASGAVPKEIIELLLKQLDHIETLFKDISAAQGAAAAPSPTPASAPPLEDQFRTVRADIGEMDALLDGVVETHTLLNKLREAPRRIAEGAQLTSILLAQLAQRSGREKNRQISAALDRAHATADDLRKLLARLEDSIEISIDQMDRELQALRGSAEQLRLISAGTLFAALERLARDVARDLGKNVATEFQGADIHLDAYVLSILQGALVQIMRNAVAHGIEPEAERRKAKKPAEGRIKLAVTRSAGQIVFTVTDDGRGIDMAAVRAKAEEAGLIHRGDAPSESELTALLLRGGISTSARVTDAAGRGIGLDVVQTAMAQLSGKARVTSKAGAGTTFELSVPVSVSALQGLLVDAGSDVVTIPLDSVKTCLRLEASDISSAETGASILYEGEAIPFVTLSRALFGGAEPARPAWSAVVIGSGDARAAIGVDRLRGTARVVVRPLSAKVPPSPLLGGVSLDAEGNPQLVLDSLGLLSAAPKIAREIDDREAALTQILVVDDSLTTRMLEQSILESAGYAVDTAASGEEGLEAARRKTYALILVDVEMPGIDGFTFVEQVRADPVLHGIPVILVTSRNAPEDIRRGEDVRANGYVVKGEFNQTKLLNMIRPLVLKEGLIPNG
ncbi:MAG: response regulator [Proteobacteria bacterium]|nr:response regulator [Pseudomonadota bacterium]